MEYDNFAVVLIAHGSNLPYNKIVVEELREMMARRGLFKDVRVAFMQLNDPSIEKVIGELVDEGVTNIIALPVFLAKGAHTIDDIPNILKEVKQKTGNNINIIYGDPIGADERVVDILIDRVKEALNSESL
ncbi:MAG: sirohydrochlorin nickelochelatase [Canidatus Methanoxibalbensis ujae]|nr:sirohydrochlorin nickelochelatase [Candidatus Methanoxibalbensis ujae]MCW7079326.1 sirohydrochlorin nickelochelatase [Candidatus Methanoxibalbensis ujae]RLG38770.1 MAG: sirohydrochlorin nickelochelatase [Methanosarcinales archaeon]